MSAAKFVQLLFFSLIPCLFLLQAQAADLSIHAMRAAYLFNFTKFVDWPETAALNPKPIRICMASNDGQDHYQLATINGKTATENKLDIFRLGSDIDYSAEQLESCHLIYIDEAFGDWHKRHDKMIADYSLMVTEGKVFKRGAIHLHPIDNKLRFEIGREVANSKEYKISSKLMRLSRNER